MFWICLFSENLGKYIKFRDGLGLGGARPQGAWAPGPRGPGPWAKGPNAERAKRAELTGLDTDTQYKLTIPIQYKLAVPTHDTSLPYRLRTRLQTTLVAVFGQLHF